MKESVVKTGILTIIGFQMIVLCAEYLNAVYPLWTGREISLKTVPVDPRSLFRGNYARLKYDVSTIAKSDTDKNHYIRQNEIVYVRLKPGTDGIYEYDGFGFDEPETGLFIRGRIQYSGSDKYHVRYGIEAYFAPKRKALALEKELSSGGIAKVMVADNGKAALKNVVGENRRIR